MNSCEEDWGPLSLTSISGMPHWEKTDFKAVMTLREVTDVSLMAPGNLEK